MIKYFLFTIMLLPLLLTAQQKAGDEVYGTYRYEDFEKPTACRSCHVDIFYQWDQAMMSKAYTHDWDEIEYFKLAVPHAEKDEKVAGVKAGCNGCHSPIAFMAGDTPPPTPDKNSRANESVSCDVCHTITGFAGDIPYNYNYISKPKDGKQGPKPGLKSPHHTTIYNEFVTTAEYCGTCHNEQSPYGTWVKATQLEWKEGPYSKQGVVCQQCHMTYSQGKSALMAESSGMIAQHLFHGAHDEGKLRGVVEMRIHPRTREVLPAEPVVFSLQLHNAKAGHKFPTGSAEERVVWVHVEALDAEGNVYHLPVDKKGFDGEEFTIASTALAYQDMAVPLGLENFEGIRREDIPEGDRIFRLPYLDPQGRMTIMQWNTASFGPDYRIGPRETKIETYTWNVPDEIALGTAKVKASLYYRKLPVPVQKFLEVPEEESQAVLINTAETYVEIVD